MAFFTLQDQADYLDEAKAAGIAADDETLLRDLLESGNELEGFEFSESALPVPQPEAVEIEREKIEKMKPSVFTTPEGIPLTEVERKRKEITGRPEELAIRPLEERTAFRQGKADIATGIGLVKEGQVEEGINRALGGVGVAFGGVVNTAIEKVLSGVGAVAGAVTPEIIEEPIKEAFITAFTPLATELEKLKTGDPVQDARVDGIIGLLTAATGAGEAEQLVKKIPAAVEKVTPKVRAGIEVAERAAKKVVEKIKPITEAEKIIQESGFIKIGNQKIPTTEPTFAGGILQRIHRPIPTKAEQFAKTSGKPMGEWLVERGIIDTPEGTVSKLFDRFKKSKSQADTGFEAITGKFKDPVLTRVSNELLELERQIAKIGAASKDKKLVENLVGKLKKDGLTMTEINTLKRLFERKVKTEFIKDSTKTSTEIQAKTNLDNKLREWQSSRAQELGFDDLAVINKETQQTRAVLDAVGERFLRQQSNNAISLTDWVVATGASVNPSFLGALIGKKIVSSDIFQKRLAKLLAIGKKKIGEPEIKSLEAIERKGKIREFRESIGEPKSELPPALPQERKIQKKPSKKIIPKRTPITRTRGRRIEDKLEAAITKWQKAQKADVSFEVGQMREFVEAGNFKELKQVAKDIPEIINLLKELK